MGEGTIRTALSECDADTINQHKRGISLGLEVWLQCAGAYLLLFLSILHPFLPGFFFNFWTPGYVPGAAGNFFGV